MKKVLLVLLFLVLVFICFGYAYFILPLNMDGVWNYGFGYNIVSGLVPYLDYNMIIPPLWPYLVALFLKLFGNSIMVYYFLIGIILSIITIICYKKIGLKSLFIYFVLLIYPHGGYNIFCLLLFVILISVLYSDKYKNNDVLIAVIISLIFLTKQTFGLLIIPSIIYSKNKKKTISIYLLFILLMALYLVINNNFFEFIDYAFLGMLDFSKNSGDSRLFFIIAEMGVLGFIIWRLCKTKDRILFYILMFQIIVFPIFEPSHFLVAVVPVLYYAFINYNKLVRYLLCILVGCFVIFYYVKVGMVVNEGLGSLYKSNRDSFMYYKRLPRYTDYRFDMVSDYLDKYNDYKLYILASNAYIYKLELDIPINKYDLINDGNMGYHGSSKYLEEIRNYCDSNNCLFIVDSNEVVRNYNQLNREITQYIIMHYLSIYSSSDLTFYVNKIV